MIGGLLSATAPTGGGHPHGVPLPERYVSDPWLLGLFVVGVYLLASPGVFKFFFAQLTLEPYLRGLCCHQGHGRCRVEGAGDDHKAVRFGYHAGQDAGQFKDQLTLQIGVFLAVNRQINRIGHHQCSLLLILLQVQVADFNIRLLQNGDRG